MGHETLLPPSSCGYQWAKKLSCHPHRLLHRMHCIGVAFICIGDALICIRDALICIGGALICIGNALICIEVPSATLLHVTLLSRWTNSDDKLTGTKGAATCCALCMLSANAHRKQAAAMTIDRYVLDSAGQRGTSHIVCTPFTGTNKPAVWLATSG